jgi:hypothetical protein
MTETRRKMTKLSGITRDGRISSVVSVRLPAKEVTIGVYGGTAQSEDPGTTVITVGSKRGYDEVSDLLKRVKDNGRINDETGLLEPKGDLSGSLRIKESGKRPHVRGALSVVVQMQR